MSDVLLESIRVSLISMAANFLAVTLFWILIKIMFGVFKSNDESNGS
ncbi:MAG: hypothetical protein ACYCX4_15680 [Bacillota bacterium]